MRVHLVFIHKQMRKKNINIKTINKCWMWMFHEKIFRIDIQGIYIRIELCRLQL